MRKRGGERGEREEREREGVREKRERERERESAPGKERARETSLKASEFES